MKKTEDKEKDGLFKSIFVLHAILFFHVLLIGLIGLLAIFLRGVEQFLVWIFSVAAVGIIVSGVLIYRRIQSGGRSLRGLMRIPGTENKTLELSLLGGLASLKIDGNKGAFESGSYSNHRPLQLENITDIHSRELGELARMLENNIISPDEYSEFKKRILDGFGPSREV